MPTVSLRRFLGAALASFVVLASVGACDEARPADGSVEAPACTANTDCTDSALPFCALEGECVEPPAGGLIGWGDGSAASVTFTVVFEPDKPRASTDLAFHPSRDELWVLNYQDDSVFIVSKPGASDASWVRKHDPDAMHFMHKPPALAFGDANFADDFTFGVCGDDDGNGGDHFMGPALFSSSPTIFAKSTPGGLGSHLDMLHSTSFCRGIAHETANVYWTFNAELGSLDKYDFHVDHGPGEDDHSDGEIWRYARGQVAGVDGVVSHMFFSPDDQSLYVADTGNARIVKLDTTTGTVGKSFAGDEPAKRRVVDGAVLTEIVPAGTLDQPSGLELHDGVLYVSDSAQSRFYAFTLDGTSLRTLDTGLPPGSLAGLTVGPDGRIYFVDRLTSRVLRIDSF